jgi:hypothetical protein
MGVFLSLLRCRRDSFAPVFVVSGSDQQRAVNYPHWLNFVAINAWCAEVLIRDDFFRLDQTIRIAQHARRNLKPLIAARAPDAMRRVRKMIDLHMEPLLEPQVLFDPHDVAVVTCNVALDLQNASVVIGDAFGETSVHECADCKRGCERCPASHCPPVNVHT